ncbi:hypothetical protein [Poseidonocella sp. HB161398]|uniref:hypothetical protein n=1 Tax=Poseidonocella sp. HB161398 TaxID=2320855 RepID=UPI0011098EF7|nr:hypothetical protein [Poseidonocella sp. HB161398]
MADIYDVMWPPGVPLDLWNLPTSMGSAPVLPFMNISIARDFIVAALIGGGILIAFGWKRFNISAYSAAGEENRVLSALSPMRMRGQKATTWAYTAYVCMMLGLYISLTFFGKLILTLSNSLPIAGIQVNADTLDFDTPAWPLALALGFAGLAPIFGPVAAIEVWMRTVIHNRFGIPSRLEDHTEKLVIAVREIVKTRDLASPYPSEKPKAWLEDHLRSEVDDRRIFRLREELRYFLHWNSQSFGWPRMSERRDLEQLKGEIVQEARDCLEEFEDIITDPLAGPAPAEQAMAEPAARYVPQAGPDADPNGARTQVQQRKKLEQRFDRTVARMETLRDELATILSLSAERDSDFASISHGPIHGEPDLRTLLWQVFPETYVASPVLGLLWFSPLVFLSLALLVQFGHVAPLASVPLSTTTTLMSAGLYLLDYLAVIAIPAMAVFFWRYRMIDTARWLEMPRAVRIMIATAIAVLVSAAASVALAVFWNALISANGEQLRQRLFDVKFPNALFHASMAVVSAWIVCCALVGEEIARWSRARLSAGPGGGHAEPGAAPWVGFCRLGLGLLAAAGTFALVVAHRAFWRYTSASACADEPMWGLEYFRCQLELIGPELVIFPPIALLACTSLMRFSFPEGHHRGAPALAATLAVAVLAAMPGQAQAQAALPVEPDQVVVGFRADAEPFVFRIEIEGETMYTGYLADLCYGIFANSRYEVLPVEITAADRFETLLKPEDLAAAPRALPSAAAWRGMSREKRLAYGVDVLCDPITLRYEDVASAEGESRGNLRSSGIFSPILFASGVSYLETNKSQAGDADPLRKGAGHAYGNRAKPVLIGYVESSTAAEVAEELCTIDYFGIRTRAEARLSTRSKTAEKAKATLDKGAGNCDAPRFAAGSDPAPLCDPADLAYDAAAESLYRFCVTRSHRELIDWFCSPGVSAYHHVYLGDRDLIHGKLATWEEHQGECGSTEIVPTTAYFTYEPYALVVTRTRPELVRHVQRRVYEFFSDKDGAVGQFVEHFPGQRMSPALAYLHLINAVSRPNLFKHAEMPERDSGEEVAQK